MAKSFEEIMTEMNNAQAEYAELNEMDSPSAVSIWYLIKNMFAMLYLTLQKNFDSFRDEIDNRIISQQIGTLPWYVDMLKKFQYTDDIYVADNNVGYAVDDDTKKIKPLAHKITDLILYYLDNNTIDINDFKDCPLRSLELNHITLKINLYLNTF